MFAPTNLTKSTLLRGPSELTKALVFEAAIHWAEQGHRVIYITQIRIQSLPATYHDRRNLSPAAFKLMRFMYLPTYEILVEQLATLHTFAVLPSVLLVDDLDAYAMDIPVNSREQPEVRIAKLCTIIQDSTNACSRILKHPVHLCVSTSIHEIGRIPYSMYFDAIWYLRIRSGNDSARNIELSQGEEGDSEDAARRVYNYRCLADRALVLKQISDKLVAHG